MLTSSDYIHSQPQLRKALGTAFPRQPLSKEAQELLNQLNKIKQQLGHKQHENQIQNDSSVRQRFNGSVRVSPPPEAQHLIQHSTPQSESKSNSSPFRDLQSLHEQPMFENLQNSELPQPNLLKTLFYFPSSPIVEQMEEDIESPMQTKQISNRLVSKFALVGNFKTQRDTNLKSEESEYHSSLNIYRSNDEFITEDITEHHEDLKQLQLTLFQRIDQLNLALKKSLGQTKQNKENNKIKQNQSGRQTVSSQVSAQKTTKSLYVKWSGASFGQSESVKNSFSDDGQPVRKMKKITSPKSINTLQVNLRDDKKYRSVRRTIK